MFTLKIQPENGTLYELTHNYGEFEIVRIDGLSSPMNNVNISTAGNMDGGKFNSSHLQPRNVVITAVLYGNIEQSRQKLYSVFPQKSAVTIYFQNKNRNLKTVGYVESNQCSPFDLRETASISIICPDPYWHDVAEISESFGAFEPTTINNVGDAPTGFNCRVEFSSDNPPSVTLAEASNTLQAIYPYQRNLILKPMNSGTPVTFDQETQKITELAAALTDYTANISAVEIITKEDDISGTNAEDFIHVSLDSASLGSGSYSVNYAIATNTGGTMDDIECTVHESTHFSNSINPSIYNCNINFDDVTQGTNFDPDTDVYKLYLRNASGWVEPDPASYTLIQTSGFYANFSYNLIGAGYTAGKFVVYHDTNSTDIRSTLQLAYFSETRNVSTGWDSNLYESVPAGYNAAKDVPYINGERITAADIESTYILPESGTAESYSIIFGDPGNAVDFKYVYSLNSDDIRTYTDTQIAAGLLGTAFTEKLTIWNNTSGEWMQFKKTAFQLGDVLEVCTIKGSLKAAIVERDGETVDISLLSDVYKNGYFFELKQGENEIEITAESGDEYVSATLTAEFLYGGA